MSNSQLHPQGWISVGIDPKQEDRAKRLRARRDLKYRNIFIEADSDLRWVGELGEWVFKSWVNHEGLLGFVWILDNAAGQPDFISPLNTRIDVKTVKRKKPPREGYTAQITARHAEEPIDHFFFMTYDFNKRCMWLLGGLDRDSFMKGARFYGAGEWVHDHYQVREEHGIFNIDAAKLIQPKFWLKLVAQAK
ncbi:MULTISPECIES: hypothetical protein [Gammaproteobacteria]|uniref:hypothetical protein n=1 Tax=Gammaproteobacteria TaxID=1236 RepID=UPI0008FB2D25|nr:MULTISPECIES: hypothetical protein [Gammaproteobacteria]EIU2599870.1 hypothetical protein [Pseudomonas aeruginosa]EIU2880619.1 hypothetical protein [Pseudomonas aeruginosa]EKB9358984.1 hypothetical protein [Pseudomonas aeruginosa]EKF6907132.1 hypothetical protein [Pseudomonas aeruginosa]EKJ2544384.1 hypothetical protein [Pseudomonas aeruginosa]